MLALFCAIIMIIIALMLITCGIQNIQYYDVILESLNNHNTYVVHELFFFYKSYSLTNLYQHVHKLH